MSRCAGGRRLDDLELVESVPDDGRPKLCRDEAVHLAATRMPFEGRLREEQLAIERHLETAAATWHENRSRDLRRPRVEKLSHQTGGSIRVVSDDAELDLEHVRSVGDLGIHGRTLCGKTWLRYIRARISIRVQTFLSFVALCGRPSWRPWQRHRRRGTPPAPSGRAGGTRGRKLRRSPGRQDCALQRPAMCGMVARATVRDRDGPWEGLLSPPDPLLAPLREGRRWLSG